ncbi:MAG: hypothetical protein ACT4QF_12165 [Sporichthyaceae bacterium]
MWSVRARRSACASVAAVSLVVAMVAGGTKSDASDPAAAFGAASLPVEPVVEPAASAEKSRAVPRASRSSIRSKGPHQVPPVAMANATCELTMPQGVWKLDVVAARTLAMLTAVAYHEERPLAKAARAFEHSLHLRYRSVPTPDRAREMIRRNEYRKGGLVPHTWAVDAVLAMYDRGSLTCAHPIRPWPVEPMLTNGLTMRAQTMVFAFFDAYGGRAMGGFDPEGITSGHIEESAHYDGRAVDISFPRSDPDNRARGWLLANWFVANADYYSIATVIFDDLVWTLAKSPQGWRKYVHPSGDTKNVTLRHLDHIHVDVVDGAPEDDTEQARTPEAGVEAKTSVPAARRPAAPAAPEGPAGKSEAARSAKPTKPTAPKAQEKKSPLPQGVLAPPKVPKGAPQQPGRQPGPPTD